MINVVAIIVSIAGDKPVLGALRVARGVAAPLQRRGRQGRIGQVGCPDAQRGVHLSVSRVAPNSLGHVEEHSPA
jgi:hypothetical protein